MENEGNLVRLINSMTKSEKRYFKLFLDKNTKEGSNHYIKLFDLIEKTGSEDKKVLDKLYANDDFMQKQFRVYKHLLYRQILKSLRQYHAESSVDDHIMELIRDAKTLYDKTLYKDAAKLLEKAKSIAYKHERYALIAEIIRWQKWIITTWSIYNDADEKAIALISDEEKWISSQINNSNEYWKLHASFYRLTWINGQAREQKDIEKYNVIMDKPVLKDETLALSYQAKRSYYYTYFHYFNVVNNAEQAYIYAKKLVTLMEAFPHQIEDNPSQYYNVFFNYLFATQALKKYEELFNEIPHLESIAKRFQLPGSVLVRSYYLEFASYVDTGQYNKALRPLSEIEALFKKQIHVPGVVKQAFILYKAIFNFGIENYSVSLSNLNILLNDNKIHLFPEMYSFSKILWLIVHLEKENTDLLPYLVKSVYRFLKQKKQLYKVEALFIRFIRTRITQIRNRKDQINAFKELKKELYTVISDPLEAKFLEHFDMIAWLDSKIEDRPFAEILREKN